jgi:hypothetical protein
MMGICQLGRCAMDSLVSQPELRCSPQYWRKHLLGSRQVLLPRSHWIRLSFRCASPGSPLHGRSFAHCAELACPSLPNITAPSLDPWDRRAAHVDSPRSTGSRRTQVRYLSAAAGYGLIPPCSTKSERGTISSRCFVSCACQRAPRYCHWSTTTHRSGGSIGLSWQASHHDPARRAGPTGERQ